MVNGLSTGYVYDGVQALAEFGANEAALLTGLAIDEAIGRFAASGDRTLLTDALGSVVAETRADQTIATAYGYSPYGETVRSGEDSGNSTQYTGRENDGTGMYYYRARYYDPIGKRLASEDPIGLVGGLNSYRYVAGDPVQYADPMGEIPAVAVIGSLILKPIVMEAIKNWACGSCLEVSDYGTAVGLEMLLSDELIDGLERIPAKGYRKLLGNSFVKGRSIKELRHLLGPLAWAFELSDYFDIVKCMTERAGTAAARAFEPYYRGMLFEMELLRY